MCLWPTWREGNKMEVGTRSKEKLWEGRGGREWKRQGNNEGIEMACGGERMKNEIGWKAKKRNVLDSTATKRRKHKLIVGALCVNTALNLSLFKLQVKPIGNKSNELQWSALNSMNLFFIYSNFQNTRSIWFVSFVLVCFYLPLELLKSIHINLVAVNDIMNPNGTTTTTAAIKANASVLAITVTLWVKYL